MTAESWGDCGAATGPGVTARDAFDEVAKFDKVPANGGATDGTTVYGWVAVCDGATRGVVNAAAAANSRLGVNGEAPRINTEDDAGVKGRTCAGVLDSARTGAGVVVCLDGREEVVMGCIGEAIGREPFDHDPIFDSDPVKGVNGFIAVSDDEATYRVVEGSAAASSGLGLDRAEIAVCDGAATAGVVKGSATALSLIGYGRGGSACVHDGDVTYDVVGGIAIAAFPWIWVDGEGSTCVYDGAVTHDVVEGIAATYSCTGMDCGALPINNENNPGMKEEACAAAFSVTKGSS